jgi:hypothetical protein
MDVDVKISENSFLTHSTARRFHPELIVRFGEEIELP